jgi:CheY-like chemotaxis protein/anti-sigma regulatory factor (Ser/Thr protein kinase)
VRALRHHIEFALDAMDDMLESLLDMARLDAGSWRTDPEIFPLDPLLARLEAEFQPEAVAAGLSLRRVAIAAELHTDRRLLERMLRNLIANALRYTSRGGIVIGARRRGGSVRIDVVDTGIGIPREQWQIIFQEFHQLAVPARQHGKGLGLGLAIVDRAARLIGATVDVFSEPGRGSRFSITLPRASHVEAAHSLPPPAAPDATVLERRVVLLVEDDAVVRAAMSRLLRSWQCDVFEADTTDGAVQRTQQFSRAPDVIIADYQLSGADRGTDAIRAVRVHCARDIPALVVSGDPSPALRDTVRDTGAMFLLKPVPPSKLRATLNYLLSNGAQHR